MHDALGVGVLGRWGWLAFCVLTVACSGRKRDFADAPAFTASLGQEAGTPVVASTAGRNSQNPCLPNPCLNNGTCQVDGTCECLAGFSGAICQIAENDCLDDRCQNGSSCVDLPNGFRCECLSGYTGELCEVNIDDCVNNPCQNGGVCVDRLNAYTCQCPYGYSGVDCERPVAGCANTRA